MTNIQASLFETARDERERRTLRDPSSYDEMIEYLREAAGFVAAPWCGSTECEARVKDDSSATIRCLPLGEQPHPVVGMYLLRGVSGGRGRLGAGVLARAVYRRRSAMTRMLRWSPGSSWNSGFTQPIGSSRFS